MSKYTATVTINNNIEYKYSYGKWVKLESGKVVSSGKGYSYEAFLEEVMRQFPITKVDQFYLVT